MAFDDPTLRPGLPDDPVLVAALRTDHAGEMGAVWIYRGILSVARSGPARIFALEHLKTEMRHLKQIEAILPRQNRSVLLPLWKLMGFLTGFLPSLFGPRVVFATIAAVETFVDRHYAEQIDAMEGKAELKDLRDLLIGFQADEVHHRDEAAGLAGPDKANALVRWWTWLVEAGSKTAVAVSRRI